MRFACLIAMSCLAACFPTGNVPDSPSEPAVTYTRDVQPLIAANCQSCHTAGGIAPFALDTYAQAKAQAVSLAAAVSSRAMPPWMPSDDCVPLRDARRLTEVEIATFGTWADLEAPEGAPVAAPAARQQQGLERVDASLQLATAYTPQPGLSDDYRCFVLPPGQAVDRDIVGINIKPGARQMVHHVIAYAVNPLEAKAKDDAEAGEGWTCFAGPGENATMIGGWVPGTAAVQYPKDTGITLAANQTIVIQIHYNVASGAVADQTSLELQFASGRVPRPAQFTALANWWFNIPPRAMQYTATADLKAPSSGTVWGVFPHMHTKGSRITVKKAGQCLVDVPQWDFHWQQSFFFASPTGLPFSTGEQVDLSCTWDNPTNENVRWGEKTTDEMCLAYFYVTK